LSIECRDAIDEETGRKMGDCFFGCDRCQEVCPFNGPEQARHICLPSTKEILGMRERDFNDRFGRTALARGGLEKLQTNIRMIKSRV
jgi:epoxyqueuosine reductase